MVFAVNLTAGAQALCSGGYTELIGIRAAPFLMLE